MWAERGHDGNHHPCSFQVLDGGTKFCNPPKMQYCFYFVIFLGRGGSSAFHLAFPTIIVLTPQVGEPIWGFCQLLSISVQIMPSGTGGITTGWVWGHTGPIARQTGALKKTPLLPWPPQVPTLSGGPQWLQVFMKQMSVCSQCLVVITSFSSMHCYPVKRP